MNFKEGNPDEPCCTCTGDTWDFYPDSYFPEVQCLVRTTIHTETHVDVSTKTEEFSGGSRTSVNTVNDPRVTTPADSDVYSTDTEPVAGRFEFDATPVVTTETDESITGPSPPLEFTRTTTTTKTTVEETITIERKLALRYDVSDVYKFGGVNRKGEDLIRSAHVGATLTEYTYTAKPTLSNNIDESVTMTGFPTDEDFPADFSAFDSLKSGWYDEEVTLGNQSPNKVDVLSWIPDSAVGTVMLLIDSGTDDAGARLDPVELAIADRQEKDVFGGPDPDNGFSQVEKDVDWHDDFDRVADSTWLKKTNLPAQDYKINFANFLPDDWFDYSERKFKIELLDDSGPEVVWWEAEFEAGPSTDLAAGYTGRYNWYLKSNGTAGEVTHRTLSSTEQEFDDEEPPVRWGSPAISVTVRDEVIEFFGGSREEGAVTEIYQHVPWCVPDADIPLPPMKLRVSLTGDDTQAGTIDWTEVAHKAEGRNLDCPVAGPCQFVSPYMHNEWRIEAMTLAGAVADPPTETVRHIGCRTEILTEQLEIPGVGLVLSWAEWREEAEMISDVSPVYVPQANEGFVINDLPSGLQVTYPSALCATPVDLVWRGLGGGWAYVTEVFDGTDCATEANWFTGTGGAEVVLPPPIDASSEQYVWELDFTDLEPLDVAYDAEITVESSNPYPHYELDAYAEPDGFDVGMVLSGAPFGDGVHFRPSGGDADADPVELPSWVYFRQEFEPTYGAQFDPAGVAQIGEWLEAGDDYWYRVGAEYFQVDSEGTERGPFTESSFVAPSPEAKVTVTADLYTIDMEPPETFEGDVLTWCEDFELFREPMISGCYVIESQTAYEDVMPPNLDEPEGAPAVAFHPLTVTRTQFDMSKFEQLFTSQGLPYVVPTTGYETPLEVAAHENFAIVTGTAFDIISNFDGSPVTVTPRHTSLATEWDGAYSLASSTVTIFGYEAAVTINCLTKRMRTRIVWEKVVPEFTAKTLPSLDFEGADAMEGSDEGDIMLLESVTFSDLTTEVQAATQEFHYRACYTRTSIPMDSFSLTVGSKP